ncbi:MAG: glucans biosynthesis glucosyltransferase MdoH [Pseudomonadota bacterium]
MPPPAPLAHPVQDLGRPYRDGAAPGVRGRQGIAWWRIATFAPAVIVTGLLIAAFTDWFAMGGISPLEGVLIGLIAVTFFWICFSLSTVTVGIVNLLVERPRPRGPVRPLDVALLMPIYNENPSEVFGNASAMLAELAVRDPGHRFSLFVLSDTRDDGIAAREERAFAALAHRFDRVFYRRRGENTDRKVGNLADWVERWGGGCEAMLVLDADSLMSGDAVVALADELSTDPSAGLIQSFPQLFGATTLFGRVQQFASTIYGAVLAEGLATWADREGNYWGHNAIIRTAAFAGCAGLPRVDSWRRRGALILSHDFVEAGLLRRAGWAVRFLPRVKGSYEEAPATLIDYVLRDRRWCQGNLQHLGLLRSKGFHGITRFHLFHGAVSYLMSPAWFVLLCVWAVIGISEDQNVIRYFSGLNPQVAWPEMSYVNNVALMLFMYAMLLAPKALGAAAMGSTGLRVADMGGARRFAGSVAAELVLAILYAPILMVQQTLAVVRSLIGIREIWTPQARGGGRYGPWTLVKFHALETLIGGALAAGMAAGLVSLWLLPIAVSLVLAAPLSALSGWRMTGRWSRRQLATPSVINAPRIIRAAQSERRRLRQVLDDGDQIAAE